MFSSRGLRWMGGLYVEVLTGRKAGRTRCNRREIPPLRSPACKHRTQEMPGYSGRNDRACYFSGEGWSCHGAERVRLELSLQLVMGEGAAHSVEKSQEQKDAHEQACGGGSTL